MDRSSIQYNLIRLFPIFLVTLGILLVYQCAVGFFYNSLHTFGIRVLASLIVAAFCAPILRSLPHAVSVSLGVTSIRTEWNKSPVLLQCIIVAVIGAISIINALVFHEMIPVNQYGWDGELYGNLAQNFQRVFSGGGITDYSIQKILPSAIIHYTLVYLQLPLTPHMVKGAFEIYNLLLIVTAVLLWGVIIKEMMIGHFGKWAGFFGLFMNFAMMKWSFYYPVLTDTSAFFLGILFFYFYIKRNTAGMFVCMLLASVTWASFIFMFMPLFMFPVRKDGEKPAPAYFKYIVVITGVIAYAAIASYTAIVKHIDYLGVPSMRAVLPISILLACAYLFFSFRELLNDGRLFRLRSWLDALSIRNLLLGIMLFIIVKAGFAATLAALPGSHISQSADSTRLVLQSLFIAGNRMPLLFMVSAIVFFGPVLLMTIIFWKQFFQQVRSYGLGMILFISFGAIFLFNSESRHSAHFYPVLIFFTAKVLGEKRVANWMIVLLGCLSFFYSKVWLFINSSLLHTNTVLSGSFLEFPWQKYFMNMGIYMSNQMYIIQTVCIAATMIIFWFLFHTFGKERH